MTEIDVRHRAPIWRPLPTIGFLFSLACLLAVGVISIRTPPRITTGIPDDAVIRRARRLLSHEPIAVGPLRFDSAWWRPAEDRGPGDLSEQANAFTAARQSRLSEAGALLEIVREQRPFDPRVLCALGHVELASHRFDRAARRYRAALEQAGTYGEARLGLGIALALSGETDADPARRRALRLQAIAQFSAVPERDPVHVASLYDRALLMVEVGRRTEAERHAAAYWKVDSGSPWARYLESRLQRPRGVKSADRPGSGGEPKRLHRG